MRRKRETEMEDQWEMLDALWENVDEPARGSLEKRLGGGFGLRVEISVDFVLFGFCYSWNNPTRDHVHFRRLPAWKPDGGGPYNQTEREYGRYLLQLAGDHAVDVVVGFWHDANGRPDNGKSFKNFMDSIAGAHSDPEKELPRIALSMGWDDPVGRGFVVSQQWDQWVADQFPLDRYHRFRYRAERNQRFPVFFWGISQFKDGTEGDDLGFSEARISASGELLSKMSNTILPDGSKPFLVWESHLVHEYARLKSKNSKSSLIEKLEAEVFARLDGIYQHGCHIPELVTPLHIPDLPNNWEENFETYSLKDPIDDQHTVTTRTWGNIDYVKDRVKEIPRQDDPQKPPLHVIPGTFPQYSREKWTVHQYKTGAPSASDTIIQARVVCESVEDLGELLEGIGARAQTWNVRTGMRKREREIILRLILQRPVALTSLNEWPEGTTIEPCVVRPNNDETKYGMDYGEEFLDKIAEVLDKRTFTIKLPLPG